MKMEFVIGCRKKHTLFEGVLILFVVGFSLRHGRISQLQHHISHRARRYFICGDFFFFVLFVLEDACDENVDEALCRLNKNSQCPHITSILSAGAKPKKVFSKLCALQYTHKHLCKSFSKAKKVINMNFKTDVC
ncbi:unnamed protein product [Orchesella dallaii]|uniref:Secreted protein n=1 Tax=Orchesella dallaii TaxID=48710 RepID=A0ABP1RBX0_9HEXA